MSEAQEKNKALVRRFLEEVHTKGNLDAIDELLSSAGMDGPGRATTSGAESVK